MPTAICLFKNEVYEIIENSSALERSPDGDLFMVSIVLIERIEEAKKSLWQSRIWVQLSQILTLPSCIDYEVTEWTLGVMLYRNATQNNQDNV